MTTTYTRKMLAGLLLGLLLLPIQPPEVKAQFGFGIVHDPKSFGLQVSKKIEDAANWLKAIDYYRRLFDNAYEQLSTMRGVMGIVDKHLAKDMQTAQLTWRISQIIHGSRKLKQQLEYMVRYEIGALRQMDDRLKNGIFDPGRDRADFEEYLLYSMGRNSKETMNIMVRTAKADAQLSKWMTERDQMMTQLYAAEAAKRQLEAKLEQEQGTADAYTMQAINLSLDTAIDRIVTLREQIRCLDEQIEKRVNEYGMTLAEMENMGYPTRSTKIAWESSRQAQANIARTFDASIRRTHP